MSANKSCERIEELVGKVADGEALDWEIQAVDAHCAGCASCALLREDLQRIGGLVRRDVASAVEQADFSGLWRGVEKGLDRVDAQRSRESVRRLLFSWGAVSRWAAVVAVAAAFAFAIFLPSDSHHFGGDNRVEVSSVEGGADNTVMIYEQDDVTVIWVMDETYEERAL